MSGRTSTQSNRNQLRSWIVLGLVASIGLTIFTLSLRSPAQLDQDGYELAIALYRVCNQRSEEGLRLIEGELAEHPEASNLGDDAGRETISSIVQEARAGNWDDATRACRGLLDDQVRRE